MERVAVSWSGGKDSVLALHESYRDGSLQPARLFSSVTEGYERITMHGVRIGLVGVLSTDILNGYLIRPRIFYQKTKIIKLQNLQRDERP